MADPIRQALERLQQYAAAHPEHDTAELVAAARAALAAEPPAPAVPDEVRVAFTELERRQENLYRFRDLREELAAEPPAPDPSEALAARPLLEAVARLGDCIGQHTVDEITTISDRAAAWLAENPPGQPVAIEPRGCPTPGACSCVEAPAPAPAIPLDLDALLSPEGAYEPGTGQEDDAQLVDQLQWWVPMHGCETLENLLDRIRRRILPHLRPPIAGIDVPGPDGDDGDYGGLQELCDAEGVDVRIGAPLLKRAREAWGATQPPESAPADHVPGAGNMVPAAYAARLRQCPTHGQLPANAWACPECLRELREGLARLRGSAVDGEREEREELATFLTKEAVAMDYWFERDTAKKVRRAAALLREPASAPAPEAGEAEELAQWLEFEADNAQELGCATIYDHDRLRWAAGYLRQLPPEGLEAIRHWAGDDHAVIQRTSREPESWAIRAGSSCMSTTGEWDIEPMPSDRTDEWLTNHRWPSAAAAWAALQQARRQEVGDE